MGLKAAKISGSKMLKFVGNGTESFVQTSKMLKIGFEK